jgi:hypothetical protein
MNAIKTYKIANRKKGQVEYGSRPGGVWEFKIGKYTKMTKVPGGKKVAERIAEALHKSWIRTASKVVTNDLERIDATCRRVIDHLTAVRRLADWKPTNDWWSNATPDEPTVKMVTPANSSGETVPWHLPPKGISAEDIKVENLPVVAKEPEAAIQ